MFCIAAFIVLCFCAIFSGRYRQMARKAWHCVLRRVTFRPCDINFSEEVKGKLMGRMILTHPGFARFTDRWIDTFAWLFVGASLWSLAMVAVAGLNLMIYDTCNPQHAENCALGGEACSVASYTPGFWESLVHGRPHQWFMDQGQQFGTTVRLIPARFQTWTPDEYVSQKNSWFEPFDPAKPRALEIIDPGCSACAHLFANVRAAGFEKRYNVTYIAYPIPDKTSWSGYKFMNSHLIASYLAAMKQLPPGHSHSRTPADWLLLDRIYTGVNHEGMKWQELMNLRLDPDQARAAIHRFAGEFGYSEAQIGQLDQLAGSPEVRAQLAADKRTVEEKIHTVKIPTILFGGRRYDRVLNVHQLR